MAEAIELKCSKCGRSMQMVMDTPLCPICDADVIFELNAYVKDDMKRAGNQI